MTTAPTTAVTWSHKFTFAAISTASGLLMLPILLLAAPALGEAGWGQFSWVLALAVILETLTDFGLKEVTTRAVARDRSVAAAYLANSFGLKTVLGLVSLLVFVGSVFVLRPESDVRLAALLLGLSALFRSGMTTMRSVFYAIDRYDLEAAIMVGDRALVLLCGLFALRAGYGVVGLSAAFAVGRVLALTGSAILLSRFVGPSPPAYDFRFWKTLQTEATPIGVFVVILQIYFYADTVMLGLLRTDAETGIYRSAYNLYEPFGHVPSILAVVLTPFLARVFVSDRALHRRTVRLSLLGVFGLSIPVSLAAWWFAEPLIALLYRGEFAESAVVFQILALGFFAVFPLGVLQAVAVSMNAEQALMRTAVIGCVVKVGVTAVLITRYGSLGAATGTVFGEVFSLALLSWALSRRAASH